MTPTPDKIKKKVMQQVVDKLASLPTLPQDMSDPKLFEQIIGELRSDRIVPLTGLEKILGRNATREDFKDHSYDYDTRGNFFADMRKEKTHYHIRTAIIDAYKSKLWDSIDHQHKASLKAYQNRLSQIPNSDNPRDFEQALNQLSDMIDRQTIKLKKGHTVWHITISNQDLYQILRDRNIVSDQSFDDYIHHINQIAYQNSMQSLQKVINKQIKQSVESADRESDRFVQQVESCFVLPGIGDIVDSYQCTVSDIVQGYLQTWVNIEDIIVKYPPSAHILPVIQSYQQTHDVNTLDADALHKLYMRIYDQISPADQLQGLLSYISTKDALVGSALQQIVTDQHTGNLTLTQKQALIDTMQSIRLSPKNKEQIAKLIGINTTEYEKFVKQILNLQCMQVSLWHHNSSDYTLNFISKDIIINNTSPITSIQNLKDVDLDFACTLWEDFTFIYQNRFATGHRTHNSCKPGFFMWKWKELQAGDLISIVGPDGTVHRWYPQIVPDTPYQTTHWLSLYQEPPHISPRSQILHIDPAHTDEYNFDTSAQSSYKRQFYLHGAYDLKGLFLLFHTLGQTDKITPEQLQEAEQLYRGEQFVSQFHKNQESDITWEQSSNPLIQQIISGYNELAQDPNPSQTLSDYLHSPYDAEQIYQWYGYLLYALDHQILYAEAITNTHWLRVQKLCGPSHSQTYQNYLQQCRANLDNGADTHTLHRLYTAEAWYIWQHLDAITDPDNVQSYCKSKLESSIQKYRIPDNDEWNAIQSPNWPSQLNTYDHFLKAWGKLGWDTTMTEPKIWDSLYFAQWESELPKLSWYGFNGEWTIGRWHSFWTKRTITDINYDTWEIAWTVTWVEQTLWSIEHTNVTIAMNPQEIERLQKNFPGGIIKVPKVSWSDAFHTLVWLDFGGKMPKHFSGKSGKWEQTTKGRLTSQILWKSQTINLHQRTKKRYMGTDAHNPKKPLPDQRDPIKYRGITENVLDAKGNTKYTALMYEVEKTSDWVTVSMQHPKYKKNMTWDNFLIFVMDKWLKPYHQQDIEAIKSKVDIISMEEDEEQPRSGAKNKGGITGFAPIDTHVELKPLSKRLGWWVSRNNVVWGIKKRRWDMQHHRHHASDFKQKRVEYRLLQNQIWSKLGKIRPPIGHIFSEMEWEGSFRWLDEAITEQIKHAKAELDAKVNASAKARQVMEVLSHGSHLTKPSRYQNDRERLKICWYLLWCLENGWPYNRTMKSIAPKDGKWVAAILWAEHVKLYHEEFDRRKVEWEQNPNAQNLNSLNMVEMDYIWRVIDSDEQQKFIFWSSFKSMLENGYKNDGYKKGDNINAAKDKSWPINEFNRMYEGLKNDKIGKDLFEGFMGGMWHAAWLIKNGGFKTDHFNKRSWLLFGSMFSGWTLFRGDDFSQTHHFWKLGRDFGIHPITAQMLIDKKTWWSEMIGHIFDRICEAEWIIPPFSQATKRDRSRLGPGVPHAERIAYINRFTQWRWEHADTIMPYMSLSNADQPGKNLLEWQDDPYIQNYIDTFLREDKSPVDIDAKWHVDPTVFNYRKHGIRSFPKGMMVTQLLKFDARWGFKGSAGEQNSSYFWGHFGQGIDEMGSNNMNQAKYDFVMKKVFICFGERFDGESKATFLNALRLLKLWGDANRQLAYKLLYTATIINFQERLQGPMPGPVDEALRKFINFVSNHSHEYCSDDLVTTIFHYDTQDSDNVESYVSRADPQTQWLYTPSYYINHHHCNANTIAKLKQVAQQNIHESLNKYEAKKSGMLTVNQADSVLKETLGARVTDSQSPQIARTIWARTGIHPQPWPNPSDIGNASHRNQSDITQPTQEALKHTNNLS